MKCKKCGYNYCKITSQTETSGKDYSVMKGLVGTTVFGKAGYILGFSNSTNIDVNAFWICDKCGYKFKA